MHTYKKIEGQWTRAGGNKREKKEGEGLAVNDERNLGEKVKVLSKEQEEDRQVQQRAIFDKYNQENDRGLSLFEQHRLKKEKEKESKGGTNQSTAARREFDRNKDLKSSMRLGKAKAMIGVLAGGEAEKFDDTGAPLDRDGEKRTAWHHEQSQLKKRFGGDEGKGKFL